MKAVKIATVAAMTLNLVGAPINVLADQNPDTGVTTTTVGNSIKQANHAVVSKFLLYGNDLLNTYNEVFKMANSNIASITNNGGNYPGSTLDKAIDGDMNTHWETGKPNTATFNNEVIFNFNETTSLDRIVYAARQAGAKGKGFAQEFEIYSSTTDEGDDFTLVSSGEYTGSTGDIVEIQFNPTEFKRLKFVYKKANQDWASASEFLFYKEDSVSEKIERLFTDDTFSTINKEFSTPDALKQLESEIKDHPLYSLFKEEIENAKALLNQKEIEPTTAIVSKLKGYGTEFEDAYSEAFRMSNSNISKVTANGGSYPGTKPEFMLDDQPTTHWETAKNNDASFTNELVFELNQAEVLDRVAFLARSVNQKGFPEKFEIYASETSKGETFQLVSSGEAVRTSDFLEFKFEPTKFKRIKFKFTKAYTDRPFAAEFRFYKEDAVSNKMDSLFTDKNKNQVSEQFNSVEKLKALEESVKSHPLYETFKEDIENALILLEQEEIEPTTAVTKPFEHYANEEYSKLFRMELENIQSIRNNAGHYGSAVIENAIDGNLDTYWETNKGNSADFSNEVEVTFKKAITLDRIMYGARKSDRKGFAEEFEIYASQTSTGDTYQLVSTGQHKVAAGLVEAKFEPTKFKRIKFKFKKSTQSWASLSELSFYKEDSISNKMDNLFTDEHQNKVSEPFNTLEKLEAFEQSVQSHPLYELYKEKLENAKALLNEVEIEATIAEAKPFEHYSNEDYSNLFKMDNDNIKSIRNNAKHYSSAVIENAIDGDLTTYWETNTGNTAEFTNEVEVEFKKAVELNRIMYGARPSDGKGFAEEFEIYASQTSAGDTYQLVSTGGHAKVSGLVEAKFEPTTFKRVKFKFKKSNQNWATLSELAFYTEDAVQDKVNNIFTDGTMSEVVPAFNNMDQLNALENEAKAHPLYSILKEQIDLAKKIVKGEIVTEGHIITAEQRGDMKKHASQNLRMTLGTNNQPTGMAAMPGDIITVYVESDSNSKLPSLVFSQQEGSWSNWARSVKLVPGKNTITVPEIPTDGNYHKEVTKGGPIYIENPYTAEEQGKAPVIRFEGTERIPFMTENTDPEEFKAFLTTYKQRLDEDKAANPNVKDRKLIDVVEMASEHVMYTGSATAAYKAFIIDGNNPIDTIKGYDVWMKQIFDFYGLDGRSDLHDPKRIRENIRVMQPWGFMYAAGNHTGIQSGQDSLLLADFRKTYPGWGLNHEIGHRMAVAEREYGEVTNNMVSMWMSVAANNIDNRIPFENEIYKNVIEENKVPMEQFSGAGQLAVYWQLELAHPGYWAELNSLYRERKVSLPNGDNSKQQYLIEFSSEVLGMDLSSYFARHGFTVNPETKEKVSKYPAPKKIWYLNNSLVGYEGNGFNENTTFDVNVKSDTTNNVNTLTFTMDKEDKKDFLGYEVYRNGKLAGFTSTDQFVDQDVDTSKNHTYRVVAFDKKLNTLEPVEFNAFKPSISLEEYVTLKLHQAFDPMDYVKATTSKGEDITEHVVVKSSNVDVTKKGNYEIVYEVNYEGSKVTKATKVTVTSDFAYLSDLPAASVNVGWGSLQKDKSVSGGTITLIRQGVDAAYAKGIGAHANSEVVYDIEGKGFDFFESYIGIDQAMKGRPSSATFEVWVDGEKKYDSNVFKADTEHEFVKVPVTGAKEVKLVTTDAKNNGNTADHTVWADAKFVSNNAKPQLTIPKSTATKVGTPIDINEQYTATDAEDGDLTKAVQVSGIDQVNFDRAGKYEITYTVTDSDGNETTAKRTISVVNMNDYNYLSDFDWSFTQNSYTAPKKDISISNNTLRLTVEDGSVKAYEKGIGAHSNSTIVYDLTDKDADYFTSFVGIDRQMYGSVGSVIFQVFVDGEMQFDSGLMNSRDAQKSVEVNISGAKELKLVVTDGGNGNGSDHATWGDAKLHFANTDRVFTKDLETAIKEAKAINTEDYTAESVAALQASIAKAEETLANKQAAQADIDQAAEMLKQAKEALIAIDLSQIITIPDTSLSKFIKQALGITGEITLGDMHKLTNLSAAATRTERVISLEGLQYAKNLVTLDITGNEVTDFSPLQGLEKLENLIANPQVIEMPSPTGQDSVFNIENLVKGLDGKHVNPIQIGLRHNKTFKDILVNVDQLEDNATNFTIDLTEEEKGIYTLVMVYEVEGNMIQIISIINNN